MNQAEFIKTPGLNCIDVKSECGVLKEQVKKHIQKVRYNGCKNDAEPAISRNDKA